MEYIFLSEQFYNDYNAKSCPEITQKPDRPYVMLLVKIDGLIFAIPFRSNIRHKFSFITDEQNSCGIDYSKAVVITQNAHIDSKRKPKIRKNEYKTLIGKEQKILTALQNYVHDYKKAVVYRTQRQNYTYKYSTLQYFHEELGLK
jgi:protein AbiQ